MRITGRRERRLLRRRRGLRTRIALASSAVAVHPVFPEMADLEVPSVTLDSTERGASLQILGLGKTFYGRNVAIEALRDVDLSVTEGEFVTILGPSGCGKSTLLNLVAGLERPTTGCVEMDGERVEGSAADRIVVFQDGALFPWLDVRGNVEFGLRVAGVPKAERRARVAKYLEMVQLQRFSRARIHELSGGMKQRVALARALVLRPRVLLMDEPFAALDPQTREEMQSMVQELWLQSRTTILFVTHDVREAVCLGDRIVVLSDRPGCVKAVISNAAPRPRTVDDMGLIDPAPWVKGLMRADREAISSSTSALSGSFLWKAASRPSTT